MGVRGLSSYVSGCQRSCSEHVDLNANSGPNQQGTEPMRLAVDGLALVYHVMKNAGGHDLHLDLGCDYGSLHDAVLEYLSALTRAGVALLVVIDGMQDLEKEATTLDRRRSQAADASSAMTTLSTCGGGRRRRDTAVSSGSHAPAFQRLQACSSLLPLFAAETLVAACRSAGVLVRAADREADPELAAACRGSSSSLLTSTSTSTSSTSTSPTPKRDRSHTTATATATATRLPAMGCCDAVLSNDSDFLVVDIPGYIPFWSLGVGADGSAGALVFRRSLVAARLGIPGDRMADLACLVGNDWIAPEERVHRVIMEAAATGGGNNSGPKKKRKAGTAATRSRNGGAGGGSSSSSSRSNNSQSSGNGSVASTTAPAKDLVEATARYLAEFLHPDVVAPAASASPICTSTGVSTAGSGGVDEDNGGGAGGEEGGAWSARRLCASFFPTLLVGDDDDENDHGNSGDSGGGGGRGGVGGKEQQCDGRRLHPPSPPSQGPSVRNTGRMPSAAAVTNGSSSSAEYTGSTRIRARAKKGKGRNKKSRRNGGVGNSSSASNSGGGRNESRVDAEGSACQRGAEGAPREPCVGGDATAHGEEFLRKFLLARQHFEVPSGRPAREEAVGDSQSAPMVVMAAAETATGGGAGRGLVLSSVGLRAGIQAPPELAQAVLEGVFWCRVMLEDSTTNGTPTGTSSAAPDNSSLGGGSGGPVAEGKARAAFSSAFASFSDARKGLYELCLTQLAAARVRVPMIGGGRQSDVSAQFATEEGGAVQRRSAEDGRGGFGSSFSERAAGTTRVEGGRGASPSRGTEEDESGRAAEAGKGGDSRRVLEEGDEWVVREFRRVGSSVKTVTVVCRVPPLSSWLPPGSSLPRRWNLCLVTLGLAFRDNRLLMMLMSSEERQATESSRDAAAVAPRPPPPLTAVALVAALLISTKAAATSAAPTPAAPPPPRDPSHPFKAGTASSRGEDEGDMIIPAFVAAVTSCCCCCPTEGTTGKGEDDMTAQEGAVSAGRSAAETSTAAPGDAEQCSWCQVLRNSQPEEVEDREEHAQGGTYYQQQQQPQQQQEEDGLSEEKMRGFVNSWSKVQSAVWHVNACLAVLRLTTPTAAAGGAGGGRGGALSPVNPLRLRPALALELFRRRERLRLLCEHRLKPKPGKQPGQRRHATGRGLSQRSQRRQQQQQQQQQLRAAPRPPAPREEGRSPRASRNGSSGLAGNHPTASTVGSGKANGQSEGTAEREQQRQRRRRHPGPLPCREQPGRCCRVPPCGEGCAWAGRVREVLGAIGFAFPV